MMNIKANWQNEMKNLNDCGVFLFNNEIMSDVTFLFPNEIEINAHTWILSMLSSVFYKMFKANTEKLRLPISDSPYESFLECIRFIYTNNCILTNENVFEILALAKKYCLEFLDRRCLQYILNSFTVSSALETLENAMKYEHTLLIEEIQILIKNRLDEVLKSNSILNIPKEVLKLILSLDGIQTYVSEVEIFNAAIQWADNQCALNKKEANGRNIRYYLGDLIKLIRFPIMNVDEFSQCLIDHEGLLTFKEGYNIFLQITTQCINNLGFDSNSRRNPMCASLPVFKKRYYE